VRRRPRVGPVSDPDLGAQVIRRKSERDHFDVREKGRSRDRLWVMVCKRCRPNMRQNRNETASSLLVAILSVALSSGARHFQKTVWSGLIIATNTPRPTDAGGVTQIEERCENFLAIPVPLNRGSAQDVKTGEGRLAREHNISPPCRFPGRES